METFDIDSVNRTYLQNFQYSADSTCNYEPYKLQKSGSYCRSSRSSQDTDSDDDYLDDESTCSFDSRRDDESNAESFDDSRQRPWRRRRRAAGQLHHQRHAANLRERRRMLSINDAFEGLRTHIPTLPYEKRLSKVDTLRLAIGYINFLADLLATDRNSQGGLQGPPQEPPKRIIVSNRSSFEPYSVHSISWTSEKEAGVAGPGTMVTKLWTPEDPRTTKQKYID